MQFLTYAHYKPDGSIFYIGKGTRKRAFNFNDRTNFWKNVVKKHGAPTVEILASWPTEREALDHEIFLIDTFRQMGVSLANITNGGDGVSGLKHNDLTKTVLREKSLVNGSVDRCKSMAVDPVCIEKRRASTTGKKRSEQSKQKMADAKKDISRPITVCGTEFQSIAEFAKASGNYRTTIRRWVNTGNWVKLEEAYRANLS
jgi:hypothetical protein